MSCVIARRAQHARSNLPPHGDCFAEFILGPSSFFGLARAAGGGSSAPGTTGSINAAPSFAARLTAVETSCGANVSSGAGTSSAAAVSASTFAQSSQRSKACGGITAGMRSCSARKVRLAAVVMMQAVSTSSPFGPIQGSQTPANATRRLAAA
jgi:hypothetical protein